MPPVTEAVEDHWRKMLLDRLQKLETSLEVVRTEVADVKTTSAVAANESKSRSDAMGRVESDIKDLAKLVRDLERAIGDVPRNQVELEKRVKTLEEWQQNLIGRLSILGFVAAALTSGLTAIVVKLVSG